MSSEQWNRIDGRTLIHIEVDGTGEAICSLSKNQSQRAQLIYAAPDLLKACQQALYALKGREHDQFLRDAIAKATGA